MDFPEITRAVAMRLEPGDTLFLTTTDILDIEEMAALRQGLDEHLPGVKCVILSGLDIAEIHKREAVAA